MNAAQWTHELAPRVLPARWELLGPNPMRPDGLWWRCLRESLSVIMTVDDMEELGLWHHVSVAGQHRLPSWKQLLEVKAIWMGDVLAVQVLPPKAQYVNYHEHCLHLWRRIDQPMFEWIDGLTP